MVAFRSNVFGGMIPAVDDILLPEVNAAYAQNTWLQSGALEPMRVRRDLRTLTNPNAKRAFRIPTATFSKDNLADAIWMEFDDINTDVVRSSVTGDSFERYYTASPTTVPKYNTRARIAADQPFFTLGIPAPTVAPTVTPTSNVAGTVTISVGSPAVVTYNNHNFPAGQRVRFTTTGALPYPIAPDRDYYVLPTGLTTNTFQISEMIGGTPVNTTAPTVAMTIATPGIVTLAGHGFIAGRGVSFATTGALPTGVTAGAVYYARNVPNNDTFSLSVTVGGAEVNTSATQSGVHTLVQTGVHTLTPQLTTISRAYVYTWVTAYGEESAPSPATLATGSISVGWAIGLSAPGGVATDRNIANANIYRTITSSNGAATYFYVGQVPIATLSYNDTSPDTTVVANAQLVSTNWTPPPPDLRGIVEMPNGILAGFRDTEVWFCEPYRYHAWPAIYAIGVPTNIVGLGVVGQTLIVCTSGQPRTITGVHPNNMRMATLPQIEPCLSRGSIVSAPNGVFYASQNGIIAVQAGGAQNVTQKLLTKDKWLDIVYVPSLRAVMFGNSYYAWGSALGGAFEPTAFETTVFEQNPVDGEDGVYFGLMIDMSDMRVGYTVLADTTPVDNVWSDIWTGEILHVSNGKVQWLDISRSAPYGTYIWRTRKIQTNYRSNIGVMRLFYDTYSSTPAQNPTATVGLVQTLQDGQHALIRAYADGRHVFTRELRGSGEIMRLPSGFKADYWQFEIEGRVAMKKIEWANTIRELMGV